MQRLPSLHWVAGCSSLYYVSTIDYSSLGNSHPASCENPTVLLAQSEGHPESLGRRNWLASTQESTGPQLYDFCSHLRFIPSLIVKSRTPCSIPSIFLTECRSTYVQGA